MLRRLHSRRASVLPSSTTWTISSLFTDTKVPVEPWDCRTAAWRIEREIDIADRVTVIDLESRILFVLGKVLGAQVDRIQFARFERHELSGGFRDDFVVYLLNVWRAFVVEVRAEFLVLRIALEHYLLSDFPLFSLYGLCRRGYDRSCHSPPGRLWAT